MASWRDSDELDYAEQHESGQLRLGVAGEQRELVPLPDGDIPRCTCGEELDEEGEHGGGYGAWCG